jgi:hypothetical protein
MWADQRLYLATIAVAVNKKPVASREVALLKFASKEERYCTAMEKKG